MNNNPYFSIVMPVYGVEKYLEASVDSVISQTYKDFELILVDDCSPDKSPQICDKLAWMDERIKVIHLPVNGGLSNARNKGLEIAIGKYIQFMDSDDTVDSDLLEQVAASLHDNYADVVVFGVQEDYFDKDDKCSKTFSIKYGETKYIKNQDEVRDEVILLEEKTLYGYAWNKFYNLDKLKESGIIFENITLIEDIQFNVKFFNNISSLNILDITPYHYMKRIDNSLTNKYLKDYFTLNKKRLKLIFDQYSNWGKCNKKVKTILANVYIRYFFSAIQRNCDKRSKMSHKMRHEWIEREYNDFLYEHLIEYVSPDSTLVKIMAVFVAGKKTYILLVVARLIFIVKDKLPIIFSTLKQNK